MRDKTQVGNHNVIANATATSDATSQMSNVST